MRIYFIGFMGAGKTRLGKQLALLMNFSFIDLDQLITQQEGQSINEIFETQGEIYFRQLERDILFQTTQYKNTIISTGGGTPCFHNNMEWINKQGISIFLDVDEIVLCNRLWIGRHKRPLISKIPKEGLALFIRKKMQTRLPFYNQSHIQYKVLEEDQKSAEELYQFLSY